MNFLKALRIAGQYRWTIAGIVGSSLMVAILWGANIGALYPIIKVAFSGKSLHTWAHEEIAASKQRIEQLESEHAELAGQLESDSLTAPDRKRIQTRQSRLRYDLDVERRALQASQSLQPWLERYMPDDPFRTVVWIVMALLLATIVKGIFIFFNMMLVAYLDQRVTFDLRRQFFHQALRMDMAELGHQRTSGLLSHFHSDIGHVTGGVKTIFGQATREPLKMIACLIGAAFISWRLLLFSMLFTPLVLIAVRKLAGSLKRANRRALEEVSHLYSVLTEAFNGLQTVQAFTLEQSERHKFYRVAKACLQKGMRIAFYSSLNKPISEFMGILVVCLALLAGAYLTLNQETHVFGIRMSDRPLSIASLLVFYGMLIGASDPGRKMSEVMSVLQGAVAASDRLFPLLESEPTIASPAEPLELGGPVRKIEFRHVTFGYHPGHTVLHNIHFDIRAGETLAIVGPNGCGKSTLCNLLPRFCDPTEGSIHINGVDLRQLRLRDLRRQIGVVTQRALLFDDTVRANIQCGRPNATEADVIAAARAAKAHKFITEKLKDGYDTVVGMGGDRLSGGQRQRIALARAMIREPQILILDEATSQIDLESEQLIHQALEEFSRDRTVLVITHRLATLTLADRILVMNAGTIDDLGTHEELMSRCEIYRRLHEVASQRVAA
ncbi:MAG: ABC transporter ATP-binding protein [Pirellulales bacterium]